MYLFEFDNKDFETPYYDAEDDKINARIPTDTRKPVVTLKILNKLKKVRALRRLEALKREDLLSIMYGIPDEGADGGGFGGPPGF